MKAITPCLMLLSLTLLSLQACSPSPTNPTPSVSPSVSPSATPSPQMSPASTSGPISLRIDGQLTPVKNSFMAQDVGGGAGLTYLFGESVVAKGWSVGITTSWNRAKQTSQINLKFTETYAPASCPTCTAYANYESAVTFNETGVRNSVPAGATAKVSIENGKLTVSFKGNATVKFPTETTRLFELEAKGLPLEPAASL